MINVLVTYKADTKENIQGFLAAAREIGVDVKSRAEEGNHKYEYYLPIESETELFLWEQWENKEVQAAHGLTDHFKALGEAKAKFNVTTDLKSIED